MALAKFGFWESLHLFSGIKIFLMASIISIARPSAIIYREHEDDIVYQNAKLLLYEMSNVGNMTSKGHLNLLEELESTRQVIMGRFQASTADPMILPDLNVDLDHWLAMLSASPGFTMMPN